MPNPRLPSTAPARLLSLCLVVAACAANAQSSESTGLPVWELGVAGGGGRVADYPGAGQSHTRGLVAPVFIYRGRVLRIDGGSIRGRLLDAPDWELDLSATGAFNARDNELRRGMPGLDWLFGVGPQLVYKGWVKNGSGPSLHLKTRALFSTDFKGVETRGASFDPELRWRIPSQALPRATWSLSVQPNWASRELHRYFYEVAPAYATAERPAYAARSGYLGTEFGLTLLRRERASLSWFVAARAMSLRGAANEGSPLLRDKTQLNLGLGVVWTPWHSTARVAPE